MNFTDIIRNFIFLLDKCPQNVQLSGEASFGREDHRPVRHTFKGRAAPADGLRAAGVAGDGPEAALRQWGALSGGGNLNGKNVGKASLHCVETKNAIDLNSLI